LQIAAGFWVSVRNEYLEIAVKKMTPETQVFIQGKTDYKAGKSLDDNPYGLDADLSSNWVEGYQMAAYEERQSSISSTNH